MPGQTGVMCESIRLRVKRFIRFDSDNNPCCTVALRVGLYVINRRETVLARETKKPVSSFVKMNDEKTNGRRNSHSDPSLVVDEQQNAKMTDTIPDHSKAAAAQIAAMSAAEYAEAERKLLRKLDLRLIPWMTCVHLRMVDGSADPVLMVVGCCT